MTMENKTVLITGASSGIGRATAIACAKAGAKLILSGRNKSALEETASMLAGKTTELITTDLSKEEEIIELVNKLGPLDGFMHSAGIINPVPVKFLRTKHIQEIFDINFSSTVLLCSHLLSQKKINTSASIVFISSVSAQHPYTGGALYTASKAALEAFARTLALETSSKKIRVNVLAPALVRTKILEQSEEALSKEEIKKIEDQYPLGIGEPEDVANAALFLLSDASKWITGTTIKMDGGLLLNSTK